MENFSFEKMTRAIDSEIARLGWTKVRGIKYTQEKYGKASRLDLTDEQLIEYWQYLKNLPTPSK